MSKEQKKQIKNAWEYLNLFYKAVHNTYKDIYKNQTYGIDKHYDIDKMNEILPFLFNQSGTHVVIDENAQFPRNVFENPVKKILCSAPNDLFEAFNYTFNNDKWHFVSSECIVNLYERNRWFCHDEKVVPHLIFLQERCNDIDHHQYDLSVKWIKPNHIKLHYTDNSFVILGEQITKRHEVKSKELSKGLSQSGYIYTAFYRSVDAPEYQHCLKIKDQNIFYRDKMHREHFIDQRCKIGSNQMSTLAEEVCSNQLACFFWEEINADGSLIDTINNIFLH